MFFGMPRKYKLFLIEDSPDDVLLFKVALQRSGLSESFEVTRHFEDAQRALEFFLNNSKMSEPEPLPDIVVLDLRLPVFSGLDFLVRLRPLQSRPVIGVFSISTLPEDRQKAEAYGADLFLTKTYETEEFAGFLRSLARLADERLLGKH
jgi:two-component system response regulator